MHYKKLIQKLAFVLKDGKQEIFYKKYPDGYVIEVDFEKQRLDFGKLIKAENRATQSFSQENNMAENWVVLECVNRLLEKGYKPQNITLEKTWPTGHGTSGRLDILVSKDDGNPYLMIECKTWGVEFEKEFRKIKKDGGQLFTYFKQDTKADVLLLYSSTLEGNEIEYKNEIINIEEDYRSGSVEDIYTRWNKLTKQNGIFDSWVRSYSFQSKAITPADLREIKQADSNFIFIRFLEILRNHVVSDKPNAFNKIFTLFLCKIYDEKSTEPNEELAFQWFYAPYQYQGKDYPSDDNISFQKRLTDLYKKGMKEFLEKEVSDLSDEEFRQQFGSFIDDERIKQQILDQITEIRLKKNNEFAIKEVFDTESFEDNAKVVKDVVELLQGYKIRYNKRHQYLSNFFELLLTTGLKQEVGQYFTPVPISQFIIKSIPIDKIILEKLSQGDADDLLPTVIDYAAGSGHFLTEAMHEIQKIIDATTSQNYLEKTANKIDAWQRDHFDWAIKYVYGVEKDYRLVKVNKVSCYLHGDGLAKVIHGDGLANFTKAKEYKGRLTHSDKNFPQENKQFDIVISNPPYSIPAFKGTLKEPQFDLYDDLTDQSSQIECLFIERTKQLLKDGGTAGIILPASILDNGGIYIKTREIILKFFEIIAIVELGSSTFMATKTKTITLFLKRRSNYDNINFGNLIAKAFDSLQDIAINQIEHPIKKYLSQVWEEIGFDDYVSLLKKQPNEAIKNHEIYLEYQNKINGKNEADKQQKIIEIEKEKLLYFILSYPQKLVLIKTGEKNDEKKFLGYEFSKRRGGEGIHPVRRGSSIEECTQLFDEHIFDNPKKASTYIYKAFQGDFDFEIDDGLKNNINRHNLVDLINFKRANFEKIISLNPKREVKYEDVWGTSNLELLGIVADIKKGTSTTKQKILDGDIPVIAGGQEPAYYCNKANRDGNIITISASGAYSGFVNYFSNPIFASDCNTIKAHDEDKISTKLIYLFLKSIQKEIYELQRGQAQPHVYAEDLSKIKIPLPPTEIQEKIVNEISALEKKAQKIVIKDLEAQKEAIIKKYLQ